VIGPVLVAALATASAPAATAGAAPIYCGIEGDLVQNVYEGPNGGSWTNPVNWSANHLPTFGDVCVPGGKMVRVPNGTALVNPGSDHIATLRIEGTVRIDDAGSQVWTNDVYGGTNLINGGVIQVLNGSTLQLSPDQNGAPAFQNVVGGSSMQVGPGSRILLQRPLSNNGTIDLTGGGALVLDSAASAYGGTGAVVGGTVRLRSGTIGFGGGPLQVLASGGIATGTIDTDQSLELACETFSTGIHLPVGLVNNGTFRLRPPLAGDCSVEFGMGSGTTFVNNGDFVVGDPAAPQGWGHYGTSPYAFDGTFVNGPTGTMTINDFYGQTLTQTTNQGTIHIAPGGTFDHSRSPLHNTGTVRNEGGCDLLHLTSSGLLDLAQSCRVRGKATLTDTSLLRVYSSATALTNVNGMSQQSTIAGTVDVVTDPSAPPALGTVRDVFSAPASGQFAAVTSSGAVGYLARYPPASGGLAQLQAVAGGGGGGAPAISALVPARLLDTRPGGSTADGAAQGGGAPGAGATIALQVAGRAGVPADAGAAVLNVTAADAQAPGYVTVYPCGAPQPNASSLNFAAGATIPNGVIAKIGDGGTVCLFTSEPTQLLVDVAGYFTAASPYRPLVPGRLLDTREGGATIDGAAQAGGIAAAGSVTPVQVTGRAGVPGDAAAAVLNVTVTDAAGDGYVTVFPCGAPQPNASNLNFAAGTTIPNNVIAKIGDGGTVCLFTSEPTHLVVDVAGYFAPSATYAALVPGRLVDTRPGGSTVDGSGQGAGPSAPGSVTEVQVSGRGGVPDGAAAAVLNVTVTGAQDAGYVTVFPCGAPQPNASSLNYAAGATIPNGVIAKLGDGGKVCLYTSAGTHLLADVAGYFTG
jgi:hypothetical protein